MTNNKAVIRQKRLKEWKKEPAFEGIYLQMMTKVTYEQMEKIEAMINRLNTNGELGGRQRHVTQGDILRKAILNLNFDANTLDEVIVNKS